MRGPLRRSWLRASVLVALVGCGGQTDSVPDAAAPPDASPWMQYDAAPAPLDANLTDAGDAGDGETDGTSSPAAAPPEPCTTEMPEVEPCGLDPRAVRSRACDGAFWSAWSDCAVPAPCTDGAREERACGLNGRATVARECRDSQWGAWTECGDPDGCRDGDRDVESCGLNGRGTLARRCEAGQWQATSACQDPDVCVDGTVHSEACGPNRRGTRTFSCVRGNVIVSNCEGADGCEDGERGVVSCGINLRGTARRICEAGVWSDPEPCLDSDDCQDEQTRPWTCGLNGRGSGTERCLEGRWLQSECDDPDVCVDDESGAILCPADPSLVQDYLCEAGVAVPTAECRLPECDPGDTESRSCGLNGSGFQSFACQARRWQASADCIDYDSCVIGETEQSPCGLNDRGTGTWKCARIYFAASFILQFGTCVDPDECTDGEESERPCGDEGEGELPMLCIDGRWVDSGECGG